MCMVLHYCVVFLSNTALTGRVWLMLLLSLVADYMIVEDDSKFVSLWVDGGNVTLWINTGCQSLVL